MFKKILALLLAFLLTLSSCGKSDEIKPPSRVYDADGPKVETILDKLVAALETKDSAAIKSLFSEYALAQTPDIDNQIQIFMDSFQGNVVMTDFSMKVLSDNYRTSSKLSTAGTWGKIYTDEKCYEICYGIYLENSIDPSLEGVHCLQLVPQELDVTIYPPWLDFDGETLKDLPTGILNDVDALIRDPDKDGAMAKARLERFARALEVQNAQEVKAIFSPYTQATAENLDDEIQSLLNIFQGKIISMDFSAMHIALDGDGVGTKTYYVTASGWYQVTTDVETYRIYCFDYVTRTADASQEGLYRVQIIPEKEITQSEPTWQWSSKEEMEKYPCGVVRNELE